MQRWNCDGKQNCTFNVFVHVLYESKKKNKGGNGIGDGNKSGKARLRWSFNVWENVFLAEKMNRAARLSYLLLKSRSSPADQRASGLIMYSHSKNIHPDTSFATPSPLFTRLSPAITPLWFCLHTFFQGISIKCSLMLRLLSLWHVYICVFLNKAKGHLDLPLCVALSIYNVIKYGFPDSVWCLNSFDV